MRLVSVGFSWNETREVIRYKIDEDAYQINLKTTSIQQLGILIISEYSLDFVRYCIESLTKLASVRAQRLSERYGLLRRTEVCIRQKVADKLFGLSSQPLLEIEPNWF